MSNLSSQSEDVAAVEKPVAVLPLANQDQPESAYRPIKRLERTGDTAALSFAQQRLWFFDQLEPGNTSYSMFEGWRLQGKLDQDILKMSLEEIVRRHDVLRTTFHEIDGEPVQVILPASKVALPCTDLRAFAPEQREVEARRLATVEVERPFNLATGPMLRVSLLRMDEEEFILLLNMHHIASDGWSLEVFQRELSTLYSAFLRHQPSPLAELPVQYADYAAWQHEMLESEATQEMVDYWSQQLADLQPLELPTDRVRPPEQSYRGAIEALELSRELTQALKALGRREKASTFMLLLAAFQVLLARYSGHNDIAVGTPIANRTQVELEDLIGYFVNPLVIRTSLKGNPTFRELLKRVRNVCLDAYAHQNLPFEKVLEALQPERDLSRSPLYQVVFTLRNMQPESEMLQDITFKPFFADYNVTKFDLTLVVEDRDEGFKCVVDYSIDLFDAATIRQMLRHFQNLLESIVAEPQQHIAALPLLDPAERQQLLVDWNATTQPWPLEQCTHELISAQAARTPNAIALACNELSLTYGELERRSNQLAHYLRQQGVGLEKLVGLALERSVEMVIAILAVHKAGGAYVPLDPNYPAERLAYMLNDCHVEVLITMQTLLEQLPEEAGRTVLCLDRDWELIARQSSASPANRVNMRNLAVVIYTSGSTGRAKGVQIDHLGMLNHLFLKNEDLGLRADDIMAQTASHSFVISIWQFLSPLVRGAQVQIFQDEVTHDTAQLLQEMGERRVSIVQIVPSLLNIMLDESDEADNAAQASPHLRYMIATGEALPTHLCASWLKRYPHIPMVNSFGSTECSDDVAHITFHDIAEVPLNRPSAPIGHALGNMRVYVLDAHLEPVPVGVPGDLYIGGIGLSRGYLDRPDMTADRFIPDLFSNEPGARLYRMGDRARYLPDGNLEYLGRVDHLVKLRGFRIELGEIESVLRSHPSMHDALAQVREDTPGSKRLVAYVVPEEGATLEISAIRSYLKQQLPDYMVPATFMVLEALPLNANGKIDWRALPVPEQGRSDLAAEFVAPTTERECRLAEIWCRVLDVPQVGIHDNFFELGGDSLLGMRMIALAHKVDVHLTAKQLMQYQTISELLEVALDAPLAVAEQGPVVGSFPVVPMQSWALQHWPWKNPHRWNFAYIFEAPQPLDYHLLRQTLAHLMRHHDGLRIRFERGSAGWQASIPAPDDEISPLVWVDLSDVPEAEQAAAISERADALQAEQNLFEGRGFRIGYFHLGPDRPGRLLILLHLLVADAFSLRIMLHDIQVVYTQLQRGEEVQMPEKTTSIKRWAERLSEYVASPEMQAEAREYWLKLPWHQTAPLPVDHPEKRGKATVAGIRKVFRSLSSEETTALLNVMTPDIGILDILFSSLLHAFAPLIGTRPLHFGVRELGRQTEFDDVEPPANTVARLSLDRLLLLSPGESGVLEDTLRAVTEQMEAVPQRGIGHDLITYMSKDPELVEAMCSTIPRHEILLNHTGQMQQAFTLPEGVGVLGGMAPENPGPTRDLNELLDFPIFLVSNFSGDQFRLVCEYSGELFEEATMEQLIDRYLDAIRALIRHLQGAK